MTTSAVLVIEDNEKNMKLMRLMLQMGGHRMLEAPDAEKGIEIARQDHPDLILMDIQLPGMDGLQATTLIKNDPGLAHIPVVALTSYAMDGDRERALDAGCDGYLAKPIDTVNFLKDIHTYLPPTEAGPATPAPASQKNAAHILIVDDDAKNLKLMCKLLARDEYRLSTAVDGAAALATVAQHPPDVILLDVMMPGLDGYEVTRRLKAERDTRTIPIILITALDSRADRTKGLEAGAEEFLTKPVNPVEIEARIQSMLKLKRYRDQLAIRSHSGIQVTTAPTVADTAAAPHQPQPHHILIVEDDEKDLKLLQNHLALPGYHLDIVPNGTDAMAAISQRQYDLVLLDILLPGMDGFEICRRIKAADESRATQVVLITCLCDIENKIRGVESGADDYLIKPIESRELQTRVKVLLKKKRYMDQLQAHYKQALDSALMDGLTGIYNHAYFRQFLELEIKRSRRQGHSTALLMIDLDNFKQINDTLGHLVGDDVLHQTAGLIKDTLREIDVAARYGGEEFAVVLPYGEDQEVRAAGERIRSTIASHSFSIKGPSTAPLITVSIGGAVYPTHADTADHLIEIADRMLYKAKEEGKNRVICCPTDVVRRLPQGDIS